MGRFRIPLPAQDLFVVTVREECFIEDAARSMIRGESHSVRIAEAALMLLRRTDPCIFQLPSRARVNEIEKVAG